MENMSKQKLMTVVLPLVTIVALALAGYFYSQIRSLKQDPQAVAQKEVAEMVAKIGKLMVLPVGETPTLATVSDPEALKDQAFFAGAEKGDKVLIYAGAKKAILYSVTLNKVIDVAPLNIGTQKAVTPPTTEKKP
jgi:hypothetical protein